MNPFSTLYGTTASLLGTTLVFEHPIIVTLGWTLVHFVWQASLVAVVYALFRVALRNAPANARYLAALGGMAVLAVAPVTTFVFLFDPTPPMASDSFAKSESSTASDPVLVPPRSKTEHSFVEPTELPPQQFVVVVDPAPSLPVSEPVVVAEPFVGSAARPMPVNRTVWLRQVVEARLPWLVGCWLVGVVLLAVRLLFGIRQVALWKRSGRPIPGTEIGDMVQRLAQRMGVRFEFAVLASDRVSVPAVAGWFKPAILLPFSMVSGLGLKELEVLLAHEIAHIRRHDYLVNIVQSVCETLYFYHPAVWWLSRQVRIEREHCCDDAAIAICGNPMVLARTLTHMEEIRSRDPGLALAANGGVLANRIRRIVGASPASSGTWWPAGAIAIFAVGLLMGAALLSTSAASDRIAANLSTSSAVEEFGSVQDEDTDKSNKQQITQLVEVTRTDSRTGLQQNVFEGIELKSGAAETERTATLPMKYSNVSAYTFLPAHVVQQLQATPLGEIRFEEGVALPGEIVLEETWSQPAIDEGTPVTVAEATRPLRDDERFVAYDDDATYPPGQLAVYGMNPTDQRVFRVVRIENVDLGIGNPFGPINALVLDEANSEFGVLGRDWLQQVRGEAGEQLVFSYADSRLYLAMMPSPTGTEPSPDESQGSSGAMTVTSSGYETDVERTEQPGIHTLASHTYDLNRRTSRRWLDDSGTRVPADEGLTRDGVFYCMTLMFDVVAANDESGAIQWKHEWRKRDPIWRTISLVEVARSRGAVEPALELFAIDTTDETPIYKYLSLATGQEIEPPALPPQAESAPIPLNIAEQDGDHVRLVELRAKSEGRSPANLWQKWNTIPGFQARNSDSITERETLVSTPDGRVFHTSVDASEIVFNLPEGSGMRVEMFGDKVEIQTGDNGEQNIVVTNGRIQLLDQGGVVRAWASPDGGAEQLLIHIREDADEYIMRLRTKRLEYDPEYPNPPVQCVVYPDTGAPENEEQSPHGAVRYEIEADEKFQQFRFRASWRYDVDRVRQEAEAGGEGNREEASGDKTDVETESIVKETASLPNWLDTIDTLQFDSKRYLAAARQLMELPKNTRVAILQQMGERGQDAQLIALCRMLFQAKARQDFRSPRLGAAQYVGTETDASDFPLAPIHFVNDYPFLVVKGYDGSSEEESGNAYLDYCLANCDWTRRRFTDTYYAGVATIDELVSPALWGERLDAREMFELTRLRNQLTPTIGISVGKLQHVVTDLPMYLIDGELRTSAESVLEDLAERYGEPQHRIQVVLLTDDDALMQWAHDIMDPLEKSDRYGVTILPWEQPLKSLNGEQPTASAPDSDGWGELASASNLRFRLTPQTEQAVLGQPLLFRLEVGNFRKSSVTVDLGQFAPGRVLAMYKTGTREAVPYIGPKPRDDQWKMSLAPGQTHVVWESIDLNDYFLIDSALKYSVVAKGEMTSGQAIWKDSNIVKLSMQEGQLTPETLLIAELCARAPKNWKVQYSSAPPMSGLAIYDEQNALTPRIHMMLFDNDSLDSLQLDERRNFRSVEFGAEQTAVLFIQSNVSELWPNYLADVNDALTATWMQSGNRELFASGRINQDTESKVAVSVQEPADAAGWGELALESKLRSRLTLQTENPVIGQPLLFRLEVKNFGEKPQTIDLQRYYPFRVLRVQNEDFSSAAPFIGMTPQTSQEDVTLKPGESRVVWENVDLNDFFLLDEARQFDILAEGGEWAAQAFWQDSNRVKVVLGEGRLSRQQAIARKFLDTMPEGWEITQSSNAFFLSHGNGKDATVIQLVFYDDPDAVPAVDANQSDRIYRRIMINPDAVALLVAPNETEAIWPGFEKVIADRIASALSSQQVDEPSPEPSSENADPEKPWRAIGMITDVDGNPLAGVGVTAHCGMGTLMRTGTTVTDENGRYTLDFGPGIHSPNPQLVQAATISVSLAGHVEQNLHRQGDCIAALEKPDEIGWGDRTEDDLFLPGKPREINFVMVPATQFQGRLFDRNGKPAADYRVSLTGDHLPPSSSVLAEVRTDGEGNFRIEDIPAGFPFQIMVEPPQAGSPWPAWASPPITFTTPREGGTGIEHEVNGKPVDFRFQSMYLILMDEGVNWKTALKEAAARELDLKWNGLSTEEQVSAGEVYLELGGE